MRLNVSIASMPAVCLPREADGFAYLMQDWTIKVDGRWFCVPFGTKTDGASIPRFLWRICGHPLQSPRVYAALLHDWLYSGHEDLTRAESDRIYRDLLIALGWGRVSSYIEWVALRIFGKRHWSNRKDN